jgi:DeoR/GlpR family transcriptional regulator of sugar metabolism
MVGLAGQADERKENAMKVHHRQTALIGLVRNEGRISVYDLSARLGVSSETIRRDLTELDRLGKIKKVHGGATLPKGFGEGPFQQRMSENAGAKMRIGARAAGLFEPGEMLFIDTGSTTVYFAEALAARQGLTIATNSLDIANAVSAGRNENRVFLLGGEFNPDDHQTTGTMVASQIGTFRGHHAVLTVGALDADGGAMDFNIQEAQVAQAMIARAQRVTVLADATKFNALASFEVCPLAGIDRLVCDAPPPPDLAEKLALAGCQVVLADG